MALMDEFKKERQNIKSAPLKTKIQYVVDYYKWPILGTSFVIVIVATFIHNIATAKEDILNGLLLNTSRYASGYSYEGYETLSEDFLHSMNLDNQKYSVDLNTTYSLTPSADASSEYVDMQSYMALMTRVTAGSVDFIIADSQSMQELAYREYFADLSEILSDEDYAKYEPYFLYIDKAVLKELYDESGMRVESNITYPDCTKPEDMEEPIPVLIDMSHCDIVSDIYSDMADDATAFGITTNAPHLDNTIQFLDYLNK